jgi:raffinose/stachyose/melibiose transport system substrate-binding protein
MKKRTISLVATSMLALSALAGCSSNQNSSADANGKVKIEFFSYKPEAVNTFNKLIKEFEKENHKIDVVKTNSPDSPTYSQSRVAKRDIPDVIGYGGEATFGELAKAGALKDVSNDSLLKDIQPSYLQMIKDVAKSDKVYGIPYATNADAVIYNKTIFKELGIDVPQTWDQFVAAAEKIKAAGKNPFYFTYKDAWTALPAYDALAANTESQNFFKELSNGKTTFSKGQKETFDKYATLLKYANTDSQGIGYSDGNTAFAKGEAAMYLQGIWAIPEIKKANPNIDLGVFPFPVTNTPGESKVVSGVDLALATSSTTKHPKEVEKFIEFLFSDASLKQYIKEQNAFTAKKGIVQDAPELQGLTDTFAKGNVVDFPDHNIPTAVNLSTILQAFTANKDVNECLKTLDSEYSKVQSRK